MTRQRTITPSSRGRWTLGLGETMSTQRSDPQTSSRGPRRALALACVPAFMVGLDAL